VLWGNAGERLHGLWEELEPEADDGGYRDRSLCEEEEDDEVEPNRSCDADNDAW